MTRLLVVCMVLAGSPAFAQIGTWQGESAEAAAGARASLAPDGPWLPGALAQAEELEIHNKRGARPQFLERASGASLLMYVDPAGLATCTREGAYLAPTRAGLMKERDAKSVGMHLGAGRVIDSAGPDESGITAIKISWHWGGGNALELRGYVATERLVKVYTHMPEDIATFEPTVTLPGDYQLLDAPRGKPFAVSTNRDRLPAVVLEKRGAFTLVRVAQGAIGWIASSQVKTDAITPKKRRVKDIVQPVHISKGDADDDEYGVEGGVEGGVVGGGTMLPEHTPIYDRADGRVIGEVSDGFMLPSPRADKAWLRYDLDTRFGKVTVWAKKSALVAAAPPPPPPPPPPPAPPHNVPPTALEPLRLTGTNKILPDDVTKTEIERSGKDKVVGSYKLCVDTSGQVTLVSTLKSTGFPAYDSKLATGMRAWSFKPFLVNGKPTPVCTAETFIYSRR